MRNQMPWLRIILGFWEIIAPTTFDIMDMDPSVQMTERSWIEKRDVSKK